MSDCSGRERYLPYNSSSGEGEGMTMLGEAQWAWLREQLLQPAEVRSAAPAASACAPHPRRTRAALHVHCARNVPLLKRHIAPRTTLTTTQLPLHAAAQVRLVVSTVQLLSSGHGWECWRMIPHELVRMQRLISETRAAGVVFLSGDRHASGFYRLPREQGSAPYDLYEVPGGGM